MFTRSVVHVKWLALLLYLLCIHPSIFARSSIPLTDEQREKPFLVTTPLIQEIHKMINTRENEVKNFVTKEATPERIKALYQSPELATLPKNVRENGLIFAGVGSNLLTFEKPSDVIEKVTTWFPEEFANLRAKKEQRLWIDTVHLYGPFSNWSVESSAFLALWNCMPQAAWLKPNNNPFELRQETPLSLYPIASSSSNGDALNFKFCIQELNGYYGAFTDKEFQVMKQEISDNAVRITPILLQKFERFLNKENCRGVGPDDCVLILYLWASLDPSDLKLAQMLKRLEPEIALDKPLPTLKPSIEQSDIKINDVKERYDLALRKSVFLKAKLLSITSNENAWSTADFLLLMKQKDVLALVLNEYVAHKWAYHYLENSLWPSMHLISKSERVAHFENIIFNEVGKSIDQGQCVKYQHLLYGLDSSSRNNFVLQRILAEKKTGCIELDWKDILDGKSEKSIVVRNQFLELLDQGKQGISHDFFLSKLSNNGEACFEKSNETREAWLTNLCRKWIAEPQFTPFKLTHTGLHLTSSNEFQMMSLKTAFEFDQEGAAKQEQWLTSLTYFFSSDIKKKMRMYAAKLKENHAYIVDAKRWVSKLHTTEFLQLDIALNDGTQKNKRIWLTISPDTMQFIHIPSRFLNRSDDDNELVKVSDIDKDGNLELWLAHDFNKCDGGEGDIRRNIDCTANSANMGEIYSNTLSYFKKSPARVSIFNTKQSLNKAPSSLPSEPIWHQATINDREHCNRMLIEPVLLRPLDIDFSAGARGDRGDVIDMICRVHPSNAKTIVVALFHEMKNKEGAYQEGKKGFVFALIDIENGKINSIHREIFEEDATTRISDFSLNLDLANYAVKKNIRAVGVRMQIGYSPRCAEGGDGDYLSLFIPKGRRLQRILDKFPMSSWVRTEDNTSCGQNDGSYTLEEASLSLVMAPNSGNEWANIDVYSHVSVEKGAPNVETPTKIVKPIVKLGFLRAEKGRYILRKHVLAETSSSSPP